MSDGKQPVGLKAFYAASLLIAVAIILLVAAGVRFDRIGAQSFWNDEGSSYVQAMRTFADIAANAGRDIHPPGYYWLLAGWRLLAGESELALRLFSSFASVIAVALVYATGARLYNPVAGLAAAAVVALNTFSIYYAQEARMYALLAMWTAAGFWALARFLRHPSPWRAAALGVINAAGLYTQYAYPLFMVGQGVVAVVWLLERWMRQGETRDSVTPGFRELALYIGANLLTLLLFAPWLPTAIQQITTWPRAAVPVPFLEAFGATSRAVILGIVPTLNAPAIAIIVMLFGALTIPGSPAWRWILPAGWALLPVVMFAGVGLYQPDDLKLMLPAQVGVALWFGRGVWILWAGYAMPFRARLQGWMGRRQAANPEWRAAVIRWGLRLAGVLSLLWMLIALSDGLAGLRTNPAFQRADYRGIAADIRAVLRPGDAVILDAPNQQEVFNYYFHTAAPVYPLPVGLGGDDAATEASVREVMDQHPRIFAVFWGEGERDPNRAVEKTLDAHAFELDSRWYGDVRLVRYVTPARLGEPQASGATFGEHITLIDYALNGTDFVSGDSLQVELRWRTDLPLASRYKVFLQILNPDGTLATQRDSEPGGGLALTTTWTPDEIIVDRRAVELNLAPGSYSLIVGLYPLDDPANRLEVGGATFLQLATLNVMSQ